MHKHGGDIYTNKDKIDFSANLNPMGMPGFVNKAAKEAVDFSGVYPDVEYRKLAEAIAKREGVKPNNIICTNGAAELVFALCYAVKPKKAVLLCPSFEEYRQALEAVGCKIVDFFLTEENKFTVQEDFLDCLNNEIDIDMVFICNPNNPTGQLIESKLIDKIIEKCHKNSIFMVVDECFNDFLQNGDEVSVKDKKVFILKAFTKMYGMAGLRLGYGIYHDENFLLEIRKYIQPWSVSVVAQAAGTAAAEDIIYSQKTRELIYNEKAFLLREIELLAEKVYGYSANYIFFKAEENLYGRLFEKGIMIRDCSNFKGLEKGFYRAAVKTHEENVRLVEVWKEVKNG